jgi:hypothetical protein
MSKFEDLEIGVQNKFTMKNSIQVTYSYFTPDIYKTLIIPNWNNIINEYINNHKQNKPIVGVI